MTDNNFSLLSVASNVIGEYPNGYTCKQRAKSKRKFENKFYPESSIHCYDCLCLLRCIFKKSIQFDISNILKLF
jgi:hypothetical protein